MSLLGYSLSALVALQLAGGSNAARPTVPFTEDALDVVKKNVDDDQAVLVDVRSLEEWNEGHLEGSLFVPVTSLRKHSLDSKELAKTVPKDKVLYTFCVVGMRARQAALILTEQGYTVRPLKPGYEQLVAAGFEQAEPDADLDRPANRVGAAVARALVQAPADQQVQAAVEAMALAAADVAVAALPEPQDNAVRAAVETVIRKQEAAWNAGDIDTFVDYYWRDDNLTFSSGGKTTRGWTATRDRYRERYPTREKMGTVKFSNLEITPLGDAAAMVLGEWSLARAEEPIGGNFTLVFRKLDDRWLIIHDHTSQLAE
jgi:uncharacterized protein (TIGR02246 family)